MADRSRRILSAQQHTEVTEFPAAPATGLMVFKGGILYIYALLGSVTTWYPTNRQQSSYVHNQGSAATEWVIQHGMGTKDVIVVLYDNVNQVISADVVQEEQLGEWVSVANLTSAEEGYAVVFGREDISTPRVTTTDLEVSSSITLGGVDVATVDDISNINVDAKLDSADYTADDVLAKLLTVDGNGTGLDADTLDGNDTTFFAPQSDTYTKAEINNLNSGIITALDWKEAVDTFADLATTHTNPTEGWVASVNDEDASYRYDGTAWVNHSNGVVPMATAVVDGKLSASDFTKLLGVQPLAEVNMSANELLIAMKSVDGDTSGLDADLLGGVASADYLTVNDAIDLGFLPS